MKIPLHANYVYKLYLFLVLHFQNKRHFFNKKKKGKKIVITTFKQAIITFFLLLLFFSCRFEILFDLRETQYGILC